MVTDQEYADRLAAVRQQMDDRSLALCLISAPENIFYLTGLDHWGYFAPHLLIVPAVGEMTLVTREMERVTITNQVRNARFSGHADGQSVADIAGPILETLSLQGPDRLAVSTSAADRANGIFRIGFESWSSGLPFGLGGALMDSLPSALWLDVSGMVDDLRLVKSAAEQESVRKAARVSDAATAAAIEALRAGASEGEVAAECHRAMFEAGGTYPGFGPFIRPASRLGEEHTSWGDGRFAEGEMVFLEIAGCVDRYNAPMGRVVFLGEAPDSARHMCGIAHDAFDAVLAALQPGAKARDVYAAWQGVVDAAGLAHYRRHHCGYAVGIGFPPSWTGGNKVTGLRSDSDLMIQTGMTFHVMSWLMGTGQGDYFLSNTVLLGEAGPEALTTTPSGITVR